MKNILILTVFVTTFISCKKKEMEVGNEQLFPSEFNFVVLNANNNPIVNNPLQTIKMW